MQAADKNQNEMIEKKCAMSSLGFKMVVWIKIAHYMVYIEGNTQ